MDDEDACESEHDWQWLDDEPDCGWCECVNCGEIMEC